MSVLRRSRVFFQPQVNEAEIGFQPLSNQARSRKLQLMLLAVPLLLGIGSTSLANARDKLLPLVTHCIADTGAGTTGATARLCKQPRHDKCGAEQSCCGETTQVWSEDANYVSIRDRKMCKCTGSAASNKFIHGLAIPRVKVTGVEDKRRPDGIWDFAWKVAADRIHPEREVALFVNPAGDRTDDQLHVHITRVDKGAMYPVNGDRALDTLRNTWRVAEEMAKERGFGDHYGVLVTKDAKNGFRVLVDERSPRRFVLDECQPASPLGR